jgi:hypothetical protein
MGTRGDGAMHTVIKSEWIARDEDRPRARSASGRINRPSPAPGPRKTLGPAKRPGPDTRKNIGLRRPALAAVRHLTSSLALDRPTTCRPRTPARDRAIWFVLELRQRAFVAESRRRSDDIPRARSRFPPGGLHRFFQSGEVSRLPRIMGTREPKPLVAEADGNRTRQRVCTRSTILKFGDGRVAGCHLVVRRTLQSRSAALFMPCGALL